MFLTVILCHKPIGKPYGILGLSIVNVAVHTYRNMGFIFHEVF